MQVKVISDGTMEDTKIYDRNGRLVDLGLCSFEIETSVCVPVLHLRILNPTIKYTTKDEND